jgi:hypothetical protein
MWVMEVSIDQDAGVWRHSLREHSQSLRRDRFQECLRGFYRFLQYLPLFQAILCPGERSGRSGRSHCFKIVKFTAKVKERRLHLDTRCMNLFTHLHQLWASDNNIFNPQTIIIPGPQEQLRLNIFFRLISKSPLWKHTHDRHSKYE